ncbi:MAG: hypothetical protein ACI93R_001641 [Flavobacteriales bacterium]|jgi:hypothetical protein
MDDNVNKPLPHEIRKIATTYKRLQLSWFVVHYVSGVGAIISGALASISSSSEVPLLIQQNTWLWGLLASILGSVLVFLNPLEKAKLYKSSYYELFIGIQKYCAGSIGVDKLLELLEKSQSRVLGIHIEKS